MHFRPGKNTKREVNVFLKLRFYSFLSGPSIQSRLNGLQIQISFST